MSHGRIHELGNGKFEWDVDNIISHENARSEWFNFNALPFTLRLHVNRGEDRVQLELKSERNPEKQKFQVCLEMCTGKGGKLESRTGVTDDGGRLEIRRWLPWSELLKRRLEILHEGSLAILCTMWKSEEKVIHTTRLMELKEKESGEGIPCDSDSKDTTLLQGFDEVRRALATMLNNREDSDVLVNARGAQFRAHTSILRSRSPVLRENMSHLWAKEEKLFDMTAYDADTVRAFLKHIYTGSTTDITSSNVSSLHSAADKYGMKELKDACVAFMSRNRP